MGVFKSQIPNLKNTNPQFKIINRLLYHQLVISTFSSLITTRYSLLDNGYQLLYYVHWLLATGYSLPYLNTCWHSLENWLRILFSSPACFWSFRQTWRKGLYRWLLLWGNKCCARIGLKVTPGTWVFSQWLKIVGLKMDFSFSDYSWESFESLQQI